MSKQPKDASAHMERSPQSEQLFPVEREYGCYVTALSRTGILTLFPKSASFGVIGIDGREYPVPTQEQVVEVFAQNRELVGEKIQRVQSVKIKTYGGVNIPSLIGRLKEAILQHAGPLMRYLFYLSPLNSIVAFSMIF